jgi:hypothetical protein
LPPSKSTTTNEEAIDMKRNSRSHADAQEQRPSQAEDISPSAQASSKEFTRSIFVWLDGIAADKELLSSAFRVAYAISQYLNKKPARRFRGLTRSRAVPGWFSRLSRRW